MVSRVYGSAFNDDGNDDSDDVFLALYTRGPKRVRQNSDWDSSYNKDHVSYILYQFPLH